MERSTPNLTLTSSEAAELLRVHPSTVKRWCNDGELASEKTSGGHRRLHLGDVMAFARARDIVTVLSPFEPYEPHVWSALSEIRHEGSFRRLHALSMSWVARGQLRRLGLLYDVLARDPSVALCRFCDEGVRDLMVLVGEAWARGQLRAGEEHLVSQVMYEVLVKLRSELRDETAPTSNGVRRPTAVVGTMEGNQHHLGSMCVRILLERRGWDVFYLGPDVPIEDFGVVQRGRSAQLVCISLTPPAAAGEVARAVRVLTGFYDATQPYALALGGSIHGDIDPSLLQGPFREVSIHDSLASLSDRLDQVPGGSAGAHR